MKKILKCVIFGVLFAGLFAYGGIVVRNGDVVKTEEYNKITAPDMGKSGKKSINHATKEDIMQVYGFGEKLSETIIDGREEMDGFKGMEDLINLSEIGVKRYESLRENFSL